MRARKWYPGGVFRIREREHSLVRVNIMKIAMIAACPFPANRGTPSRILRMSEGLIDKGHDIHVVTYHLKDESITINEKLIIHRTPSIPTYNKTSPGPSIQKFFIDILLTLKIFHIIRKYGIELIHAHHIEGLISAIPIGYLLRIPIIYDAHTSVSEELVDYRWVKANSILQKLINLIEIKIANISQYIIAVSNELKEKFIKHGIPSKKITVIPTGVNLKFFKKADGSNIRRKLGIKTKQIIMYTGTFAPYQGLEYLLRAMKIVGNMRTNIKLLLVGNSNDKKYKDLSKYIGISHLTFFVGEVSFTEIPDFLDLAEVVVLPRVKCLGFPQKLSNYLAAGKPIVVFEGSAKGISHMINGYVARNEDVTSLARGIELLLEDKELAKLLSKNARKTAEEILNWENLIKQLEKIYINILKY